MKDSIQPSELWYETVQQVATGWTGWCSNPGEVKIFYLLHTLPDQPWGPCSLL